MIRCVTVYIGTSPGDPLTISDTFTGAEVVRLSPPLAPYGGYYQLLEGRIVVPAGFTVSVAVGDTWDVVVSGYQLYLP